MTRPVLLLAIVLVVPRGDSRSQGVAFGVHGGLNMANISTDDPELAGRSALSGFAAGPFVTLEVTGFLGLQVEGLYSQKGVEVNSEEGYGRIHVDYVEIPVLAKVGLPGATGAVRPYILAGVAFGIQAECWLYDSADATEWDCDEQDVEINPRDTGLLAGGEVRVLLGPLFLSAGIRHTWGLKSLVREDETFSVKNRVWAVLLGLGIRFGK